MEPLHLDLPGLVVGVGGFVRLEEAVGVGEDPGDVVEYLSGSPDPHPDVELRVSLGGAPDGFGGVVSEGGDEMAESIALLGHRDILCLVLE